MSRAAVVSLLLLLTACTETGPTALQLHETTPDMQPLHATLFSNLREPRRLLIRDQESWAALWAQMVNTGAPSEPPFVDFTREDVLVAAMGERRVGGYSSLINDVDYTAGAVQVMITSSLPGPACDRAEVITSPLDAVRVRKISGVLTFSERTQVRPCA